MTVRFTTGETVDVIDGDCEFRPCFALGFDKGSFVQGRGYTSYHPGGPRKVCWTRHMNGCPHVGVHPKCGECGRIIGEAVPYDDERQLPGACPECGSADDLYWLADVLPAPSSCCDSPTVAKPRKGVLPYRQRCKSCGTSLTGARLEMARGTTSAAERLSPGSSPVACPGAGALP